MGLVIFLLVAFSLQISHAESHTINPIELLRPQSPASGLYAEGLECPSWRLAVETNNRQGWKVVPASCKDYIEKYMQGGQYRRDCEEMAAAAAEFAESVKDAAADGKGVWVFDIDETTLSNLDYYARPDVQYGTKPRNSTAFKEWVMEGKATAVPAVPDLYNKLLRLGYKTVILTALADEYKQVREENLRKVGYGNWTELIFRAPDEGGMTFKSKKRTDLVKKGYKIIGNVGDQWSDLVGPDGGNRTFKVPNPMYYT